MERGQSWFGGEEAADEWHGASRADVVAMVTSVGHPIVWVNIVVPGVRASAYVADWIAGHLAAATPFAVLRRDEYFQAEQEEAVRLRSQGPFAEEVAPHADGAPPAFHPPPDNEILRVQRSTLLQFAMVNLSVGVGLGVMVAFVTRRIAGIVRRALVGVRRLRRLDAPPA